MGTVDFDAIKKSASFEAVLARYGVEMKGRRAKSCPLPDHNGSSPYTFAVDFERNIFNCFSCKGSGNVIQFVAKMENIDLRPAAELIQKGFRTEPSGPAPPEPSPPAIGDVNPPLKFALQNVDPEHPYGQSRGFESTLYEYLGAGFYHSKQGTAYFDNRFVFPLHNEKGELVGYAGRAVDRQVQPEWLMPKKEKGFAKSHLLYNAHRVQEDRVVVVEGVWGVLACLRAGVGAVVALLGSSMSAYQEEALLRFSEVTLLLDGDPAGREGTVKIASRFLEKHKGLRAIFLPEGLQPDALAPAELRSLLTGDDAA